MCGASDCTLVGLVLLGAVMASSPAAGQGTIVAPPPLVHHTSAATAPTLVRPRSNTMADPRLVKVQATAQAAPPTGQPARIAEPDSREQYKMRLQNDLRQKEAKLARQESELAAWQNKIKETHQSLISATNAQAAAKPGDDDSSSEEGVRSPAQLSKDLEAQTYYAMIAREAVMASRRDINNLRNILAQMSQPR